MHRRTRSRLGALCGQHLYLALPTSDARLDRPLPSQTAQVDSLAWDWARRAHPHPVAGQFLKEGSGDRGPSGIVRADEENAGPAVGHGLSPLKAG